MLREDDSDDVTRALAPAGWVQRRARSCMDYTAEAGGYLSVQAGAALTILYEAEDGDLECHFPSYFYAALDDGREGWLPTQACMPA